MGFAVQIQMCAICLQSQFCISLKTVIDLQIWIFRFVLVMWFEKVWGP